MGPYLIVGLVAAAIAFAITPAVLWAVVKLGAIDQPHDRKVHVRPTPTLGGTAIFVAVMGAGGLASIMPVFDDVFTSFQPLGIAAASVVIYLLGALDDVKDLPVPVKVAGQVFAAGLLFLSGVKMQYLLTPSNSYISLSDDVSVLVTVIWLVVMINAVNLADGLDGLAAGIVAIAGAAFFVYIYRLTQTGALGPGPVAPGVAIIVVGASLGFLRHNFYPARIFMGDSGAMLLGLLLGAATVSGVSAAPSEPTANFLGVYIPLLIPLSVLAIPILDALLAVTRRARRRQSIFVADKEHLHHRLMDLGHGHRQAVIVMYVWSALAAGSGLAFTFLQRSDLIFAMPVAVGALVVYTLFPVLTKAISDRLAP
ncbi:MAG: undecaprenyl/decaprenyl-phosphate alpha-N-acetylglucosaminyl 1-phosphate transferase [Actinobacteria bacterium]|nr:undecaprenyl/decaprenyl-phosphate alpha-N-acetylglucosaminyl 1-phosphate transferase [Actinomycetota bacterium]